MRLGAGHDFDIADAAAGDGGADGAPVEAGGDARARLGGEGGGGGEEGDQGRERNGQREGSTSRHDEMLR